jgi:YD repeat-containing protein
MKKRLYVLSLIIVFICVLSDFVNAENDGTPSHTVPAYGNYTHSEHENGNLVKSIWYRNGLIIQWMEWDYDEHGQNIMFRSYHADGSMILFVIREHDANGNMFKATAYNPDGSIIDWNEFEYDDKGNCIRAVEYNADGSIRRETLYNARGNPVREISYDADGSIIYAWEYEYDAYRNRIRHPLILSETETEIETPQQTAPQTGDSLFNILLIPSVFASSIFSMILYKRKR